jgi:uncharacterized protein YjbJ (UPF0337 family)
MAQNEDFLTDRTSDNLGSTYRGTDSDTDTARGANSTQIRSEIERTRADLDETFAALDAKFTPREIAMELLSLAKSGSTSTASKVFNVVKQHPMPSAVIGLGLGWLLVENSRTASRGDYGYATGYRGYAGRTGYTGSTGYAAGTTGYYNEADESGGRLSAVKEKVKDVAGSAKDALTGAREKVGDKVGDAAGWTKDHARDLEHRALDRASDLRSRAGERATRARLGFWETMESNPLMVGAATLALGVIAGLSIPSTRKENELMGETRDHLLQEVKETGREVFDKGKNVAEAMVDKVKTEAETQGLSSNKVVENVENVVEKVKTVAREAVNTAKEEARNQNLTPDTAKAHEHEPELAKR